MSKRTTQRTLVSDVSRTRTARSEAPSTLPRVQYQTVLGDGHAELRHRPQHTSVPVYARTKSNCWTLTFKSLANCSHMLTTSPGVPPTEPSPAFRRCALRFFWYASIILLGRCPSVDAEREPSPQDAVKGRTCTQEFPGIGLCLVQAVGVLSTVQAAGPFRQASPLSVDRRWGAGAADG